MSLKGVFSANPTSTTCSLDAFKAYGGRLTGVYFFLVFIYWPLFRPGLGSLCYVGILGARLSGRGVGMCVLLAPVSVVFHMLFVLARNGW
jgi:hypothetical protein